MKLPSEQELQFYDRNRVARPFHEEHGIRDTYENPLSEQLKSGNPRNWRLEGNQLKCDTDFGPLTQIIPTDYICTGTDNAGLPTFRKVLS
jgi:hypothetical protein